MSRSERHIFVKTLNVVVLILLLDFANSSKTSSKSSSSRRHPSPAVAIVAHPGASLWSGEDLALECTVRTLEGIQGGSSVGAAAVWYRSLLDPAGRRLLRSLGGGGEREQKYEGTSRSKKSKKKRLMVTERTAELISHGEILLLADQRFKISVREEEEDEGRVVYRLEIDGTKVEDSGDYECQLAGYVDEEDHHDFSPPTASMMFSQKIEINVFEKSLAASSTTTTERSSSSTAFSSSFTAMVQNDDDRRSVGNVEKKKKKSNELEMSNKKLMQQSDMHDVGKSEPSKHKDSRSVASAIVGAPKKHFLLFIAFLYTLQYL